MPRKRILIVEDDADLRRLLKTAISMAGYEVDEAADGLEALIRIEQRHPDLVVLDLVLRALDGISVQQELAARAITREIPVVIVTGSNLEVSGLNVSCVLRKPVSPDDVIKAIARCLHSGAPGIGV